MATPSTLVSRARLPLSPHIDRIVATVPSVLPASSSPRYEILLQTFVGTILQIKFIVANNTMLNAFFGSEDVAFRNTIMEVHRLTNVSQECGSFPNIRAIFLNTDTPPPGKCGVEKLYLEIDNLSSAESTGLITLEMMIQEGGIS